MFCRRNSPPVISDDSERGDLLEVLTTDYRVWKWGLDKIPF